MKLILILFAAFTVATMNSSAQRLSAGVKAGANFSNFTNVDDSETRTGLLAGGFLVYSLMESFGISADVLYSSEGAKFSTVITDGNGVINSEVSRTLNYLRVPLLANVFFGDLGNTFRPKISLGPAFGFLLSSKDKHKTTVTENGYVVSTSEGTSSDVDNTSSFDLAAIAGAGFNYRIGEMKWLNFDVRYRIGTTDVRDGDFEGDPVRNTGLLVSAGIAFGISSE